MRKLPDRAWDGTSGLANIKRVLLSDLVYLAFQRRYMVYHLGFTLKDPPYLSMTCATSLLRRLSLNLVVIYPTLILNHTQDGGEIFPTGAARVRAYKPSWILRHFEPETYKRFMISLIYNNEINMLRPLCDYVW